MTTGLTGQGLPEAIDGFNQLGKNAPRIVSGSLRQSMKPIQSGIVAAIPPAKTRGHSNESIKRSVGIRVRTRQGYITEAKVGINVGKKNPRQRGNETAEEFQARRSAIRSDRQAVPHAHFLGIGTRKRWSGRKDIRQSFKGKQRVVGNRLTGNPLIYRGFVTPTPFVRTGATSAQGASEQILQSELSKRITKTLTGRAAEGVSE